MLRRLWTPQILASSDNDFFSRADPFRPSLHEGRELTHLSWIDSADMAPRCQFIYYSHNLTSSELQRKEGLVLPVLEDDLAVEVAVTNICRSPADGKL